MLLGYESLSKLHLWTILPALIIGLFIHLGTKGTARHKFLGKVYMGLMFFTATVSLFMTARVGPTLFSHFGLIHFFSLIVLYEIPMAYLAARRGDIEKHRSYMVGLYFGGLMLAGALTLMPGRTIHTFFFS